MFTALLAEHDHFVIGQCVQWTANIFIRLPTTTAHIHAINNRKSCVKIKIKLEPGLCGWLIRAKRMIVFLKIKYHRGPEPNLRSNWVPIKAMSLSPLNLTSLLVAWLVGLLAAFFLNLKHWAQPGWQKMANSKMVEINFNSPLLSLPSRQWLHTAMTGIINQSPSCSSTPAKNGLKKQFGDW